MGGPRGGAWLAQSRGPCGEPDQWSCVSLPASVASGLINAGSGTGSTGDWQRGPVQRGRGGAEQREQCCVALSKPLHLSEPTSAAYFVAPGGQCCAGV